MTDPFNLDRFLEAQRPCIDAVLSELKQGQKQTHWMWFIFPQLAGLGTSAMATKFAISCRAEAHAYLAHPVLGPRLLECTRLVAAIEDRSLEEILGPVDSAKFKSSMTLFAQVPCTGSPFTEALRRHCGCALDQRTLDLLGTGN